MRTEELLSEPIDRACARERSAIDGLLAEAKGQVVLFGAGNIGRRVATALRREGINILAFADNDKSLSNTLIQGLTVLPPPKAAQLWGRDALFIVTTFRPTGGGVGARMAELSSLGCKRITSFLLAGWKYDGILPHFGAIRPSELLQHAAELAVVATLWADNRSRETYRAAIEWRLQARFDNGQQPAPNQYFPQDILLPFQNEVFVDGGAYDGDTIRSAPWPFSKVMAIEPDPVNAAHLRAAIEKNTELYEVLLGHSPGSSRFEAKGSMASSRSPVGSLNLQVKTLDQLTEREHPTFIKLDIEGDELIALQGGISMMKREKPVVAVCVYHRPEDLWTIPLFLHDALGGHQLYLRSHAWDGFELVAYAIPKVRCQSIDE